MTVYGLYTSYEMLSSVQCDMSLNITHHVIVSCPFSKVTVSTSRVIFVLCEITQRKKKRTKQIMIKVQCDYCVCVYECIVYGRDVHICEHVCVITVLAC